MRVFKNTLIYMAGSMANQATALVVVPILTRYLNPEQYGYAALFTTLVTLLFPIVGMSLQTHIARNFFKVDRNRMANISWNALLGLAANTVGVLIVLGGLALFTPSWLGLPAIWIVIAVVVAAANSIMQHYLSFLRVEGRPIRYSAILFISAGLNLGLSLFLVAVISWGWQGRSGGYAISTAAIGVFAFLALRREGWVRGGPDFPLLRQLYRISVPLVPHTIAGSVTAMSSRLFLNSMTGKESLGLFAVGYTFGSVIGMPAQAFNNAWTPWIFRKLAARDRAADMEIVRVTYLVSAGFIGLWLLVLVGAPWALRLTTTPAYHSAAGLISWVALSFAFQAIYTLFVPVLTDEAKTDALAIFTGGVAILSLILYYLLIRQFGPIGAAYTLVVSAAVKMALVFWYANKIRPMPWFGAAFSRTD